MGLSPIDLLKFTITGCIGIVTAIVNLQTDVRSGYESSSSSSLSSRLLVCAQVKATSALGLATIGGFAALVAKA
jgi:hypothetical protein